MDKQIRNQAQDYRNTGKRRTVWHRIVNTLTCIVVFCTTYALILPALTITAEMDCTIDEHLHDLTCYTRLETTAMVCTPEHAHDRQCYDEEQNIICGYEDYVLHTHGESCYDGNGLLLCALPELEEHTHTDACYTLVTPEPAHVHGDACYEFQRGELFCEMEESQRHSHEDGCYGESVLTCILDESEGHTHGDLCFGEETVICGIEESEGHTHADACYTDTVLSCTLEENEAHAHNESCYSRSLICGREEASGHQHNANCVSRALLCTTEESAGHQHSEACYERPLICQQEAFEGHVHGDDCYEVLCTLICDLSEESTEETAEPQYVLTCEKTERIAHTHENSCFDENGNLICGETELVEHVHVDDCFVTTIGEETLVCEMVEHVHGEACYAEVIDQLNSIIRDDNQSDTVEAENEPVVLTGTSDLNIFDVTDVDVSNSRVEYDPATDSYDVSLKLDFGLTYEQLSSADAFHIDLPDAMVVPDEIIGKNLKATDKNLGGIVAFDYWFEKIDLGNGKYDYVIHVDYRQEYLEAMAKNESAGQYFIEFSGTLDKDAVQNDGSLKLEWTQDKSTTIDREDIKYPDNETANYDLHVHKQGSFSGSNDTLTYTVKVYSEKGTPPEKNIQLDDTLTLNGITVGTPTVTITDAAGISVTGYTMSTPAEDGKAKIDIDNLPPLDAGAYYLVTYTYPVQGLTPDSTVSYPNNSVTVEAENPENNTPLTDTSSTSVKVSKEMIRKSGSYDASTNLITWTITVNPDGSNIAGYVLTDDMLQYAQSMTVVPALNNTYNPIVTDGKITGIQFKADESGENCNTYTITYTTEQKQTTASGSVSNTATFTPPDGGGDPTTSGKAEVWVPASGGIVKTVGQIDSNGNISWTTQVTVPEGGVAAGTVITDHTGYGWDAKAENHSMNQKQIYDLNSTLSNLLNGIDYTLEFTSDGYSWTSYSDAIADTVTTEYYGWRITFNQDVPQSSFADSKLTIDYQTNADLSDVTTSERYVNTVSMGGQSSTAEKEYKNQYAKLDKNQRPGTTNVTSTDGVIGWYIRIVPDGTKPSYSIEDELPAGLTLKKLGVSVGYAGSGSEVAYKNGALVSGTMYGNENVSMTYGDDNGVLSLTVSSANNIPTGQDIYVYIECLINDLPEAGSSNNYEFKNQATVDGTPVEQTQNVTVNRPATVVKMDANGNSSDSEHQYSDGTLGWFVQVYLPEGATDLRNHPIEVIDDLPEGVTLTKIGIGDSTYNARYGKDYSVNPAVDCVVEVKNSTSGTVYGPNNRSFESEYQIEADTTGQNVTVSIHNNGYDIAAGQYIYVYFECSINDNAPSDKEEGSNRVTYTFTNRAQVEINGNVHGTDYQTQTVRKEEIVENTVVDKSSAWDASVNQLQYTVDINKNADNLDQTDDILEVRDELSYSMWWPPIKTVLITSSVKLYNADGTEVPSSDWSWKYTNTSESGTVKHVITANVPDGEHLTLKYIYELTVDGNYQEMGFTINNKATVTGDESSSDDDSSQNKWESSDVNAGATSSGTYTLTKVDKDSYNIRLPGAQFTVYTYADDKALQDASGNVVTYVSDRNGEIQVSKGKGYYQEDVVYYITETMAPDGYSIPENQPKYYFYFSGDKAGTYTIPDDAVDLSNTFGAAYVENEVHENKLTVNKVWLDQDGAVVEDFNNPSSITFQLIQTDVYGNEVVYFTAQDGSSADASTIPDSQKVYTLTADDNWTMTFEHLPSEDAYGNPYTYTVREIEVSGYTSEVTTNESGNITITNKPAETTSVKVKKVWNDDSPKPVDVQLYQAISKADTQYIAYLCYAGNINGGWWPQIGVTSEVQFTDTITGDGDYNITWSLSDYFWENPQGCNNFYIDIYDPLKQMDGYRVTSATITVYNKDGTHVPVSVDTSKLNYYYNDDLGEYYYRIEFYNQNAWPDALVSFDTSKMLFDDRISVDFTLSHAGSAQSPLPEMYYVPKTTFTGGTKFGDPITLNVENQWNGEWKDLPASFTDENGNVFHYVYYVKETTPGYRVGYIWEDVDSFVIVNNPIPSESTGTISVNKQWQGMSGNLIAPVDSVNVDLYRKQTGDSHTVTIRSGLWGWDEAITKTVPHGSKMQVQFVANNYSNNTPNGSSQISESTNNRLGTVNGTAMNRYVLDIDVTSDLELLVVYTIKNGTYQLDGGSGYVILGIENVTVDSPQDNADFVKIGSYEIKASDNWTLTIPELDPGTYKVVETTTGFETTYVVGDGEPEKDSPELTVEAGNTQAVTINNNVESTSITINKSWLDNGEHKDVDLISYDLLQNGSYYSSGILLSNDNWTAEITGLPKKDANGADYQYTVVEKPLAGYDPSYSTQDETRTITNRKVTEIGVVKHWAEGSPEAPVTVQLYRLHSLTQLPENTPFDITNDVTFVDEEILCTDVNGKDKTWKNLDMYSYDVSGIVNGYYYYYVVETAVAGDQDYKATYSTSNWITSGTIEITNEIVYHYELPQTGSVGTTPYTAGGAMLMLMAIALLMYNHKKGRKEAACS